MLKTKLIFLLLSIVTFYYGQNNLVEFKIQLNKYNDTVPRMLDLYPHLESSFNLVTFSLLYNSNEMKFYGNKTSEVNDEDYSTILLMADMQGTCYRKNKSELLSVEVEKYGNEKDFIITKKLFTEWKITEGKKMVCGYECFKATTLLGVDYGDENIISLYPLTAWYCPELIYSYGPKGLGGLPGMILELEQNLLVFRAVKVSKNKQDVEIALPMNKSIISESKMYDLLEDSIEEGLNNCNSIK